ncbi:uncharacterized protein BXZ73DRAFT_102527 [Epithele typhae]|uniref:uncharacterized protein n=1 Tax=Epithele typhae TaxID=378194 RepID=UPI0020075F66|nr:uncharacterized protein BXZ73DRAFT_102527 [Epithele typhae]KAH9928021.1 hypothetical protein BXZ73DRAFT_102527 [Epithele typhae]
MPSPQHSVLPNAHRIWQIDEIAFSPPALDILWYKLNGLSPLFSLLPSSIKEEGVGATVLSDAIPDSDWARIALYTRRVRKLHYQNAHGPWEHLGHDALCALLRRAYAADTALFPNLQDLSWLQFSATAQCLPFVAPSLQRLSLYVYPSDPPSPITVQQAPPGHPEVAHGLPPRTGYGGFIPHLASRSPDVEELALEGVDAPFALAPPPTLPAPVAFARLRVLHLGSISTPTHIVLAQCSAMPRLASLSLTFSSHAHPDTAPSPTTSHDAENDDRPSLRALESLRASGTPDQLAAVLAATTAPALRSVHLALSLPSTDGTPSPARSDAAPPSTGAAADCARALAPLAATHASTLRALRLECAAPTRSTHAHAPRSVAEYVRPLLALRGLRRVALALHDPAGVGMDDGDAAELARAWPALAALFVSLSAPHREQERAPVQGPDPRAPRPAGVPRPSVASLRAFAAGGCAALESLRIPVDADVGMLCEPGCEVGAAEGGASNGALKTLWLEGVRFSRADSGRVVPFLQRCFPNVDLKPMVDAGVVRTDFAWPV